MKFNKSQITPKEVKEIEETITFKNVRKPLLELKGIKVKASIFLDDDLINVYLKVNGIAKVECAYTLEPVNFTLDFEESIDISEDEKNLDAYYVKGNLVDLDPIILDLIVGEIPTRVVKEGAKLKAKGDGYRVLTEDELRRDKEEDKQEYNPAFDKLKDLDL